MFFMPKIDGKNAVLMGMLLDSLTNGAITKSVKKQGGAGCAKGKTKQTVYRCMKPEKKKPSKQPAGLKKYWDCVREAKKRGLTIQEAKQLCYVGKKKQKKTNEVSEVIDKKLDDLKEVKEVKDAIVTEYVNEAETKSEKKILENELVVANKEEKKTITELMNLIELQALDDPAEAKRNVEEIKQITTNSTKQRKPRKPKIIQEIEYKQDILPIEYMEQKYPLVPVKEQKKKIGLPQMLVDKYLKTRKIEIEKENRKILRDLEKYLPPEEKILALEYIQQEQKEPAKPSYMDLCVQRFIDQGETKAFAKKKCKKNMELIDEARRAEFLDRIERLSRNDNDSARRWKCIYEKQLYDGLNTYDAKKACNKPKKK